MRLHVLPFAIVAWLLAGVAAWSQPAPAGTAPAFSLWSSQVYRTSEQPAFSLTHRGLDHLDVRVYRVGDPFAFFAGLKDPHALGSEKPVVPEEQSWIERIAAWKSAERLALRAFLRRQVSVEYRQQRRAEGDRQKVARRQTLRYSSFAQVPLLNPERLVASWREVLPNVREPETRRIPIEQAAPGVYVVEAVSAPLRAYTIVVVADIGIVTKTAPGQMLLFVADRSSGAPQRNCEIRPLADGRPLATAFTGPDGTALIAIDAEKPESIIAVARCGAQVTVSDPGTWALRAPARDLAGYVYTDKPVYRPGHIVRVKGVLRWRTLGRLGMFDAGDVEVSVADSNDKVLVREKRPVDAFGAVSASFEVPASAALGDYVVTVASGDDRASGTFEVQEYRKPEFEVTVAAPERFALQGGRVQATLTARYYFGQPVAGATVKYVVHRQPYFSPLRWSDGGDDEERWWGGGSQAIEATARLDANGTATVGIPLDLDADRRDYTARVEARVTDASNREVAGSTLVHATYGRYMVVAQADRYVRAPGATAQVGIRAIDYLGAPQAGASLDAVLERLSYAEGRWSDPVVTRVAAGRVTTDQDGRASWAAVLPDQPGPYRFRVSGLSEGRTIEGSSGVWVTGDPGDDTVGDAYLELIADRSSYQPGDVARLIIRGAAVTSPVLVTKEGRRISYHRVESSMGGDGLEVPVEASDIGDTYVSVVFIKDDRLYRAEKRLKVPAASRQLRVAVAASRSRDREAAAAWRVHTHGDRCRRSAGARPTERRRGRRGGVRREARHDAGPAALLLPSRLQCRRDRLLPRLLVRRIRRIAAAPAHAAAPAVHAGRLQA
ncbi:MAG: MG2 domain-containing protein [Vicinamibacterales bacterium]